MGKVKVMYLGNAETVCKILETKGIKVLHITEGHWDYTLFYIDNRKNKGWRMKKKAENTFSKILKGDNK